jgi:hypothetical protein
MIGTRRIKFQDNNSLIELETLDRAMPSSDETRRMSMEILETTDTPWP